MNSLTITGVGPGDPSLLTLAAVNSIQDATVVSFPVSNEGGESIAQKIASKWITQEKKQLPLYFPMVQDQQTLRVAWSRAVDELIKMVEKGEKVVFIAQGDISIFSTGSYLALELQRSHPDCVVKLIPGITSFSAAAAKSKFPLAFQEEQLLVVPVPESSMKLKVILTEAIFMNRVVVLLKLGRKWKWVKPLLRELDLLETSLFAERVGLCDEKFFKASDLPLGSRPYFSLLLIRQVWPVEISQIQLNF